MSEPAIEGWFTTGPEPALLGGRCPACATYSFPPRPCPNPDCDSDDWESVELSRRGRVWSWTDSRYAPPAPYAGPTPLRLAAVELADEGLVVLGQIDGDEPVTIGSEVELVLGVLHDDLLVWKWRPR